MVLSGVVSYRIQQSLRVSIGEMLRLLSLERVMNEGLGADLYLGFEASISLLCLAPIVCGGEVLMQ